MPRVVTDVHDPVALARVCELLDLPPPVDRSLTLAGEEVFGWVVRLKGLRYPVVCGTLTGLIAYQPADNAFERYAHLMDFIECYYAVRPNLRHSCRRHSARQGHSSTRMKTA